MKNNCIIIRIVSVILFLQFVIGEVAYSQIDTLFWFVAPHISRNHDDKNNGTGAGPVSFNIATFNNNVTVTIDVPAASALFTPITQTIPANSTRKIVLWDTAWNQPSPNIPALSNGQLRNMLEEGNWPVNNGFNSPSNKGIRIRSTDSITVYYEIEEPNNTDLFSLKGSNALGSEFFVPFQNYRANKDQTKLNNHPERAFSTLNIVAVQNSTTIQVYPPPGGIKIEGHESVVYPNYFEVTLNSGQTYALVPDNYQKGAGVHLAGTRIKVKDGKKKVVVVITDDSCLGLNTNGWDIIGDQVIPLKVTRGIDTLDLVGDDYIVIKGPQTANDQVFVLATQNSTNVDVKDHNGAVLQSFSLNSQEQQTLLISEIVFIDANKPVMVFHVTGVRSNGQEEGGAIIPTVSMCTGSKSVGFIRGNQAGSKTLHLSVLVRGGGENNFKLTYYYFNGVDTIKTTVNLPDKFIDIAGSKWKAAIFNQADWENNILSGMPCLLQNTSTIFHLGINHGGNAGGNYGYFSNFNEIVPAAEIKDAGSSAAYFCIGSPVQLFVSGGDSCKWWPFTYLDNPFSLNPVATPPHEMTYTATIYGFCDDSATSTVTIVPEPLTDARFSIDNPSGCSPLDVSFYEYSLNADHIYWDFENDNSVDSVYHNYDPVNGYTNVYFNKTFENNTNDIITYNAKVNVSRSICDDSLIKTIKVYPSLQPVILKSVNSGCSPLVVSFSNITATTIDTVTYTWDLGDGMFSSDSAFAHTYVNTTNKDTNYIVALKAFTKHGCEYITYDTVTVHPRVKSIFNLNKLSFCSPDSVLITNLSTGPNLKYNWDFGDSETYITNLKNSFYKIYDTLDVPFSQSNYESFGVELAVEDSVTGCVDTNTQALIVRPGVVARFEPENDTDHIAPFHLQFINTSLTDLASSTFEWDFGDGGFSDEINPSHIYNNSNPAGNTYWANLIVTTPYNCADTSKDVKVKVYSTINAKISVNKVSGCWPFNAKLVNASHGTNHRYNWDFGDGTDTVVYLKNTLFHTYNDLSIVLIPKQYKVILTVEDTVSGLVDIDSITITVAPSVTASYTSIFDPAGCQPFNVQFANTSSASATKFSWEFSDGGSSSFANTNHTFINTTPIVQIFTAQLKAESDYGCKDETGLDTFYVSPVVQAQFTIDTSNGCSPFNVKIENSSTGANENSWTLGDGNSFKNSALSFNYNYINNTTSTKTYSIKLLAGDTATTCKDSTSHIVNVYPQVISEFTPVNYGGCHPLPVVFQNNSNAVATKFKWDFGNGNTSSKKNPEHVFQNITNDSVIYNVELVSQSEYFCTDTFSTEIKVMPYIKAEFTLDTSKGCQPLNIKISNNSENGNTYKWYFNNSATPDTLTNSLASFNKSFTNNTDLLKTVKIKLKTTNTNYGNCEGSDSLNVTVYPRIIAGFDVSDSINCHPLSLNITNKTIGASGITPYYWDFGNGYSSTSAEPTQTFENFGTDDTTYIINLTATSQYQCESQVSKNIIVHPYINSNFNSDVTKGCPDLLVNFTNSSTTTATDFNWNFDDGNSSVIENPNHIFINNNAINDTTYKVRLTVTDNNHGGCSHYFEKEIKVYAKPVASFSPVNTIGCHPFNVQFENNSLGKGLSYAWDFDNNQTSTASLPDMDFINTSPGSSKIYNVKLKITSTDLCFDEDSTNVEVYPYIEAFFNLKSNAGCTPFNVEIENLSKGSTNNLWNFGNGTEIVDNNTEINYNYVVTETQNISKNTLELIASNIGCSDTFSREVSVYPVVIAGFEPKSGCQPLTLAMNNTSVGYNLSYKWDFDDGGTSSVKSPTHIFYNTNITDIVRNVSITATSEYGCTDVFIGKDTIYANPQASFVLENSADCSPFIVQITNTSDAATFYWDYGDGTSDVYYTNQPVSHSYTNTSELPIPYTIKLKVVNINGCTDEITQPINVYPSVNAKFSASEILGCNPFSVDFTNETASQPATTALWNFDDGVYSRLKDANHIFINGQTTQKIYNVKLTVESMFGCKHTDSMEIKVHPNPVANFNVSPKLQIYPESTIQIQDLTNEGEFEYIWDFGDGSDLQTGSKSSYTYATWGNELNDYKYNIELVVYNDLCSDTAIKSITILPHEPVVDFNLSKTAGCPPLEINFSNITKYANRQIIWDFGDSTYNVDVQNPKKTYSNPGIYTVKLTAHGDGGTNEIKKTITVYHNPTALFEITTPKVELKDDTVGLNNLSSHADTYEWDFGDETFSNDFNPVHFYEKEGNYDISLYVKTIEGCEDYFEISNAVRAEEPCKIIFPNAFAPCLDGPCSDQYQLDNDKSDNTFHPYYQDGAETDKYSMSVYNRWGELIFSTRDYYQAWTGYYKGKVVEQGVYVFQVQCKCTNGDEIYFIDNVTVFH